MLLAYSAHATTLGFMVAVNRLKFDRSGLPPKHKRLLQLIACYVLLGYPWLFFVWSLTLAVQTCRSRVAVAEGFLVVLSRPTSNPKPTFLQAVVVWVIGGVGIAAILYALFAVAIPNLGTHAGAVWGTAALTLGPVMTSVALRTRHDDRRFPDGVLVVRNLVPTSQRFEESARTVAPTWLARQHGPVGWVADEGLRTFYEDILARWNVQGVKVNDGAVGFWAHLLPARYQFVKP